MQEMQEGTALLAIIELIRKRIHQIRDRKEIIGEQNTKAALIDPVLVALGWNLQEIDEVRREYRRKSQDNPVDYALFLQRAECLFIEAKSLEKDLNDRKWISQTLSYATVVGVKWCVLTNGDEYRIYNSHAAVDVEQKLFRSVRISDSASTQMINNTLYLLSKDQMRGRLIDELWRLQFIDNNVRRSLESLLSTENRALVRLISGRAKRLSPAEVRSALKRAKIKIDFPPPSIAGATPEWTNGAQKRKTVPASSDVTIDHLLKAGLIQAPMQIKREYKGVQLLALVRQDGKVEFDGQAYDSLSTAAGMARKSVIGAPQKGAYPQTNGWAFWTYVSDKGDNVRELDHLRTAYLAIESVSSK